VVAARPTLVRNVLVSKSPMKNDGLYDQPISVSSAEDWLALGCGGLLLLLGASRRDAIGGLLAISSAPLLYRGVTGQWPTRVHDDSPSDNTRRALGGRGMHVRESIGLEVPIPRPTASGVASSTCRDS
jgi:hypothetical protein